MYQILRGEFDGVGAGEPGKRAQDMLRIDSPTLDFVALGKSMGVPGRAVTTADEFNKALAEAIAEPEKLVFDFFRVNPDLLLEASKFIPNIDQVLNDADRP